MHGNEKNVKICCWGGEPKLTKLSHILKKNHLKKAAIQNKTVYSMYTYKGIKP